MCFVRHCVVLVLGVLLSAILAFGQSGNATLDGSVTDATGAVIPGAKVTITNTATGVAKTIETTGSGLYVAPALIPGTYKIEISAQGFRSKKITDLRLVIDQQARVDVQLELGPSTQAVTVTSESAPLLQTADASVGFVVQSQQVLNLPLNGRYFTQLLQLSAGTFNTGVERNQMPLYDVNGMPARFTSFRLDGMENNERGFGGANTPISVDAIQEVKLQTANFSAEYGRGLEQVDVVVKSGTNAIHGDLFEFVRNDYFDARNWAYSGPHNKNLLKRNQFGGSIGGPIKKNKLFYFFDFDATREHFSQPTTTTVPSNDMRNGIFPAGDVIFDPLTQQPFYNNTIPHSRWDPISTKVLAYLPPANLPGVANATASGFALAPTQNFYWAPIRTQTINQYNVRVDYSRSERNTYFGRYTYSSNLRYGQGPQATNVQGALNGAENANLGSQNLSGAWYHNFSAYTINELRGGFYTDPQAYLKADNTDYAAQLGLKSFLNPGAYPGFPDFQFAGTTLLGSGDFRPLREGEKMFAVSDTATLVRGSHSLRIGAEYRRSIMTTLNNQDSTGIFAFSGAQTRDRAFPTSGTTYCPGGTSPTGCLAGNAFADFLLGDLQQATRGSPIPWIPEYFSNWAGFVNDTWNVSKNLTVTIGFRYEYQSRWHADPPFFAQPIIKNGEFSGIIGVATDSSGNLSSAKLATAANLAMAPGAAVPCVSLGLPNNCMIARKNAWQPRLGFAYRLGQKTVVRAGAGIYYGMYQGNFDDPSGEMWPNLLLTATPNYTLPPSGTAPPPLSLSGNPFSGVGQSQIASNANFAEPNRPITSVYQWNFTVERTLDANTTLSAAYVGNTTRHIDARNLTYYNIPQPWGVVLAPGQTQKVAFPTFGTFGLYESQDSSSYNSLQVKLERHLNHGLYLSAAYTYSKNLTYLNWESDPRNAHLDRGPWTDDLRDTLVVSPIYQLPFGKGQPYANKSKILDEIIGGWQISSIVSYRTGLPFTPTLNVDLLNLHGYNVQNRPDRICDGTLANPTTNAWWNASCFVVPVEPTTPGATLRPGTSGYGILYGPHAFGTDVGFEKTFRITERFGLDFRAEMFNVFNHPILGQPATALSAAAIATSQTRITSTATNTFPRIIQLALKLRF